MRHILKLILFATGFLLSSPGGGSLYAQQYKWVKGGGSSKIFSNNNDIEATRYICTDENRNIYALATVGDQAISADTFYMGRSFHYSGSGSIKNIVLLSYDCNGNMRFAKLFNASSATNGYGLTYSNGHLYVVGSSSGQDKRIEYGTTLTTQKHTMFLASFDTLGSFKWIRFAGQDTDPLSSFAYRAYGAVATDGQGNIHQFQYFTAGLQLTPTVITQRGHYDLKYDPNGNLLGVTRLQLPDTDFYIQQAQVDKQTNEIYATFSLVDGSTTRSTFYLTKFNPSGNIIWNDTTGLRNSLGGFKYIDGGDIYISGGAAGGYNFSVGGLSVSNTSYPGKRIGTITRLDTNGKAKKIYKLDNSLSALGCVDVAVTSNSIITGVGFLAGAAKYGNDSIIVPVNNQKPLIWSVDTSGKLLKLDVLNASGMENHALATTSDITNNIFIGGYFANSIGATGITSFNKTGGNTDFFVMKYGYDCSCTIANQPIATYTHKLDTANTGVTVTFTGTTPSDSVVWDFGDGFITKQANPKHNYTAKGTYNICATVYTSCGRQSICKSVYVPDKCAMPANQPVANFTHTLDAKAKKVQVTYTGSTPNDSIVIDWGDGVKSKAISPASHTYTAAGSYNVCLTVHNACGSNTKCTQVQVPAGISTTGDMDGVNIYPNPAHDVLYVDNIKPGSRIELYDITGRKAHAIITAKEKETVNISYLQPGSYIIYITDTYGNRVTGKIVKR